MKEYIKPEVEFVDFTTEEISNGAGGVDFNSKGSTGDM